MVDRIMAKIADNPNMSTWWRPLAIALIAVTGIVITAELTVLRSFAPISEVIALRAQITQLQQQVTQVNIALAETRGNRFTSQDGKEVWQEIAKIRKEVSVLPSVAPPQWFVERVDALEARLIAIDARLSDDSGP